MRSLKGKTMFITDASRGIGRAIALRAAADGANIAIASKTDEPNPKLPGTIHTVADEIIAAGGRAAISKQKPRPLGRAGNGARASDGERHPVGNDNQHLRLATTVSELQTKSGFSFLQQAVRLWRGVRHAVVDVEVSYSYRVEVLPETYPEVRTVASDTVAFLQNYPEKKAYWERYARDAAAKLFRDYGVFSSLTVTLVIHPDELRTYLRTATATVVGAPRMQA